MKPENWHLLDKIENWDRLYPGVWDAIQARYGDPTEIKGGDRVQFTQDNALVKRDAEAGIISWDIASDLLDIPRLDPYDVPGMGDAPIAKKYKNMYSADLLDVLKRDKKLGTNTGDIMGYLNMGYNEGITGIDLVDGVKKSKSGDSEVLNTEIENQLESIGELLNYDDWVASEKSKYGFADDSVALDPEIYLSYAEDFELKQKLESVIENSKPHLVTDVGLALAGDKSFGIDLVDGVKASDESLTEKDNTLWDGLMNLIGGPKWVKNENQLESDFNNPDSDFYHSPAYGEAKAGNVQNLLGFGKTPLENIPLIGGVLDDAIGGLQSAVFGGSSALYQLYTDGFTKKAFLDWAEQQKGYMQYRFDDLPSESAEDLKSSANLLEKITPKKHEAYMSEFNKYVPAKGPDNSSDLKNFANTQISADQNTQTNINYTDNSMAVYNRDHITQSLNSSVLALQP